MANNTSRLKLLLNKVLIKIFKCFDAQDLFRAFNKLNSRFTTLIRSLNHLVFTLSNDDYTKINDFSSYVDALVILYEADGILNHFTNVRHLCIWQLTDELLKHLSANILHFSEHLIIIKSSHKTFYIDLMIGLYNKISCNALRHLKSCYMICHKKIL
jgi:hypothetical protein